MGAREILHEEKADRRRFNTAEGLGVWTMRGGVVVSRLSEPNSWRHRMLQIFIITFKSGRSIIVEDAYIIIIISVIIILYN